MFDPQPTETRRGGAFRVLAGLALLVASLICVALYLVRGI